MGGHPGGSEKKQRPLCTTCGAAHPACRSQYSADLLISSGPVLILSCKAYYSTVLILRIQYLEIFVHLHHLIGNSKERHVACC